MSGCSINKSTSSISKMKKLRRVVTLLMKMGIFCAIPQLSTILLEGSFRNLWVGVSGSSPRSVGTKDLDITLSPTAGS